MGRSRAGRAVCLGCHSPQDAGPGQAYVLTSGPATAISSSEDSGPGEQGFPTLTPSSRAAAGRGPISQVTPPGHPAHRGNREQHSILWTNNLESEREGGEHPGTGPLHPHRAHRPPRHRLPLHPRRKRGVAGTHAGDTPSCRGRNRCPPGSG